MDIKLTSSSPVSERTDLLVVGVFTEGEQPQTTHAVDQATKGRLSSVWKRGDLASKVGSTLLLFDVQGTGAERTLLVSLGKRAELDEQRFRAALQSAAGILKESVAKDARVTLADIDLPGRTLAWRVQQATVALADGAYAFQPYGKTSGNGNGNGKTDGHGHGVKSVALVVSGKVDRDVEQAVTRGLAIAEGMALARDLGNLPGNVCNPAYLADTARALGKELKLEVEILERADMEKLGMGSALSVGRASKQPCKFIVMQHRGAGKDKPIVLVGKGVTFDTGGVSLKPGAKLDEMKFDMCGAAAVFGAMKTAGRLALPINLIAIVPAVENMPGGDASRPGDVVKSMAGITIEILNTDAEGRLILCDALTYAEKFDPASVIDVATLTGACVVALGGVASGLFANDEALASELLASAADSGDRAWRMPLWDDYLELLKSNFADMSNLGGVPAGAITAACFLGRFTKKYPWAHLDIAGTASVSGDAKGATGRPVPLLSELLIRRADKRATKQVSEKASASH